MHTEKLTAQLNQICNSQYSLLLSAYVAAPFVCSFEVIELKLRAESLPRSRMDDVAGPTSIRLPSSH